MFSEISKNWAGHPLDSYEMALKYISTTKTATGLMVKAHFVREKYEIGADLVLLDDSDGRNIAESVGF